MKNSIFDRLDRYFSLTERHSNLFNEFIGGISAYLAVMYILFVNPTILSKTGMDSSSIFFATAVSAGLGTIAMGLWAKLPFAIAPGLTMNTFFALVVVGVFKLTWQQALASVFMSGVISTLLTVLPVRQRIIDSIPQGLRLAILSSIAMFVAANGLKFAGIISYNHGWIVFNPLLHDGMPKPDALVFIAGLAIALILGIKRLRFPGGAIVSVILSVVIARELGEKFPTVSLSHDFDANFLKLDFSSISTPQFWIATIIFFLVDFYGGIGKFIGLAHAAKIASRGEIPNIEKALYVDGLSTAGGALLGTSSLIVYTSAATGIVAGGRTGITAVVCGTLLLLSLFLAPIAGLIPSVAISGVLVYISVVITPFGEYFGWRRGDQEAAKLDQFDGMIALTMCVVAITTYSFDKAMFLGFVLYLIKEIMGRRALPSPYLIVTTLVLVASNLLQFLYIK